MSLASVGVRSDSGAIARPKKFWEEYDALPRSLAREVAAYESGPRHTRSGHKAEEARQYFFEENVAARKQYRLDHQEELQEERTGRILHMNVFLLMLRQAGLNAYYSARGAFPGMLGLYVNHNDVNEYVCFIQCPYMQEYEEIYFDEYDVPLGPKRRGWRTVLIRLVAAGVISESELDRVFGQPPTGKVSKRYKREMHRIRNRN